jgi:hypothetical protein
VVSDVLVDFEHPVSSSSLNIVAGTWSGKLSGRCNNGPQLTGSILAGRQYLTSCGVSRSVPIPF